MGFDVRVREAIDIIYIKGDFARGQEAFNMLKEAADCGDGDACFLLGRCYGGSSFTDSRFNFVEDDDLLMEYFNRSIELGSAIGMLGTKRLGGFEPRCGSNIHAPYNSPREVWDAVVKLALEGELFCELLIANAYYYGDAISLMELDKTELSNETINIYLRTMALTARDMYEDIYNKGMLMGYGNYRDIITSGDYGIPKSKERYKWLQKICATKGINI